MPSEEYRPHVVYALKLQVLPGALAIFLLDGGWMFRCWGVAYLAFWASGVLILFRRPGGPEESDRRYFRRGFFLTLAGTQLASVLLGRSPIGL